MWVLEGFYAAAYGWEEIGEYDSKEAADDEKTVYDTEEPNYRHRVREIGGE